MYAKLICQNCCNKYFISEDGIGEYGVRGSRIEMKTDKRYATVPIHDGLVSIVVHEVCLCPECGHSEWEAKEEGC
jgi:hypothetical protein